MGKLITGVSTDAEFLKAIKDKGAEITANATPKALADAINSVGGTIDFNSDNADVLYAVNSEIEAKQEYETPENNG